MYACMFVEIFIYANLPLYVITTVNRQLKEKERENKQKQKQLKSSDNDNNDNYTTKLAVAETKGYVCMYVCMYVMYVCM